MRRACEILKQESPGSNKETEEAADYNFSPILMIDAYSDGPRAQKSVPRRFVVAVGTAN